MSTRPSLRHGLPYGWWRSDEFWLATMSILSCIGFLLMITGVVMAWIYDMKGL